MFILNFILCCSILSSVVQSREGGMEAGAKGQKRKVEFSFSERKPLLSHLFMASLFFNLKYGV